MARLSPSGMVALVLAIAVFSISACGGGSPSPSPSLTPHSGVRGLSLVRVLAPTPAPQPYATIAVHQGDLKGAVVAKTKADSTGGFRVELLPGTYTLVQVFGGAVPKTVTVVPGRYETVKLTIQGK